MLKPGRMHSGGLYKIENLNLLATQAESNQYKYGAFLGRVITVEMALRASGSSINWLEEGYARKSHETPLLEWEWQVLPF